MHIFSNKKTIHLTLVESCLFFYYCKFHREFHSIVPFQIKFPIELIYKGGYQLKSTIIKTFNFRVFRNFHTVFWDIQDKTCVLNAIFFVFVSMMFNLNFSLRMLENACLWELETSSLTIISNGTAVSISKKKFSSTYTFKLKSTFPSMHLRKMFSTSFWSYVEKPTVSSISFMQFLMNKSHRYHSLLDFPEGFKDFWVLYILSVY